MADSLRSLNRRIIEKILIGSLQAIKRRGIQAVSEVQADGAHGRAIADAEADGLHHVIEVRDVALFVTEGDASQVGVDVAQVMEEHAGDVIAQEGKPQFRGMEE